MVLNEISSDEAISTCGDVIQKVQQRIENRKAILKEQPMGELWVQYMTMVDLLRTFIHSERTGNWKLNLWCLSEMVYYFAATGHRNYAKSVQIFLQDMTELEKTNPVIYSMFDMGLFVIRRSNRFWAGLPKDLVNEQTLMRCMKWTGGLTRGRGIMNETQRNRWLLALPICSAVSGSMQELTKLRYETSDQHKEVSTSRIKRDNSDGNKILQFLVQNNPFQPSLDMCNLITGEKAEPSVNCHKSYEVGRSIMENAYGNDAYEHSFRKKNEVITMGTAKKLHVDGEPVNIDPQLLFQRLVTIGQNRTEIDDVKELLLYELASHPTSLFDEFGRIRSATKSQLADTLSSMNTTVTNLFKPIHTVVDGGSLLHGYVNWKKDTTFGYISLQYVRHLQQHVNPVVVFDGYNGPSTKDTTHCRRNRGSIRSTEVIGLSRGKKLKAKKEDFLSNEVNKSNFINLLAEVMREHDIKVKKARADADILIVTTAVELTHSGPTQVLAEDTDVLVLLCHHAGNLEPGVLIMKSGHRSKRAPWDIGSIINKLGTEMCKILPFIHAVGGCDTTSRLYGIGKGTVLKKSLLSPQLRQLGHVFTQSSATTSEIAAAGEKVLVIIYGGKDDKQLNVLRCRKWSEKVMTSSSPIQVQSLPPTEDAAKYHSYRVYHQVQVWTNLATELNPEHWGWQFSSEKYVAKTMDRPPAPESLLKIIRCSCKGDCNSKRCSCRKHGLACAAGCGECRGISCTNSETEISDAFEDVDNICNF